MELESFLAEFVGPHLRAAGFRKSSHTYRRRESNGDEAVMQFRAYPTGKLCSFLFDVWVTLEPIWDFHRFRLGRATTYPARTQPFHAAFSRQPWRPTLDNPWPPHSETWGFHDSASRYQIGHQMEEFLLNHVLPDVQTILDRQALMNALRSDQPLFGLALFHRYAYRVLLVDQGSSDELDEIILSLDPQNKQDTEFASWAAARLLDGPTWAALVRQQDASDVKPTSLD